MLKHTWTYESMDELNYYWKCSTPGCNARVGFNKPGIGKPSATESTFPKNIEDYIGNVDCPDTPPA